jgi:uncharacterized membrane protein
MIERMKRLARNHPLLIYLLVILIVVGEFGCMLYLVMTGSDKLEYLVFACIVTAWILSAVEMIREDEEVKREAYLNIIRRINRLD